MNFLKSVVGGIGAGISLSLVLATAAFFAYLARAGFDKVGLPAFALSYSAGLFTFCVFCLCSSSLARQRWTFIFAFVVPVLALMSIGLTDMFDGQVSESPVSPVGQLKINVNGVAIAIAQLAFWVAPLAAAGFFGSLAYGDSENKADPARNHRKGARP